MRVPACSLPHVAFTVSELAAVTSVQGWSNRKVKVIGRLRDYDPTNKLAVLESVAEQEGVFQIKVNVIAIDISCIRNNSQVVIFGELDVLESTPYITAKITRECSNLNIQQNSSAVAIVQRLFPNILK
ncbi:uncharacterized protein LOC125032132 isoform X1 [Penaeus chinensis]|uniref:uncharacterized protein LOC125032132 isoform X1 n=1 Tax=Penaeus chinensis TaxID=139456 RepID=UPI001FB5B94E|nr:uncharacterized protein LOC125032132 isoform X1 [Penaeus chinensis]